MPASDHLNGQLSMFITPRQLGAKITRYPDLGHTNIGGLPHEQGERAQYKIDRPKDSSLPGSIAQEGVHTPLLMALHTNGDTSLTDGHHRAVIQSAIDPDRLMPVQYHQSY